MSARDLVFLLPEIILLAAAALVLTLDLAGRRALLRERLPYVALLGLGLAALGLLPAYRALAAQGVAAVPVATLLVADPFAIFFKALALLATALVLLAAIPYLHERTPYRGEFYALLLVVATAICFAVSATNLLMIYLSMEFLSITSYVLVGFLRDDRKSGEAALKYFLYGSVASAVMLFGMSLLYGATGVLDLVALAERLPQALAASTEMSYLLIPALILLLVGFGFKASLAPFHQWAPDTYEGAPTPITAFLSTASKAAGFAILMRVLVVGLGLARPQWTALLLAIAILTMTVGNLTALRQSNIKRLLAYSSIAQAGYILIGLVAAQGAGGETFTGLNGVLLYLFAYLFTNVGAFAVVTAVETATLGTELKDYAGLARRAPALALLLTIFLLSLAGIPPTAGFLGKFFVFAAAVQQQLWVLLVVAAVNTVIAAFYYLNVVRYMYLTPAEADAPAIQTATPLMGAIVVAAVLTLGLGLWPTALIRWASHSAEGLLSFLK